MNQIFANADAPEVTTQDSESFALSCVEDVEYEFVGGGTAVNCY